MSVREYLQYTHIWVLTAVQRSGPLVNLVLWEICLLHGVEIGMRLKEHEFRSNKIIESCRHPQRLAYRTLRKRGPNSEKGRTGFDANILYAFSFIRPVVLSSHSCHVSTVYGFLITKNGATRCFLLMIHRSSGFIAYCPDLNPTFQCYCVHHAKLWLLSGLRQIP